MTTKESVLALLEANRGHSLSGEEMARALCMSRAAVWKAVRALREDGHGIDAATNRGYALLPGSGVLSAAGICPYLTDARWADRVLVFPSVESTNKTAKELASGGAAHGTVIIADAQTAGRGRYGRTFYSPPGSGLYMSVLFRGAALRLPQPTLCTVAAAVAICRAVRSVTGQEAQIKWVNDILLGGRKVCGILTEASTSLESGCIDWLVIGIGINVHTDNFPNDLSRTAASLRPGECGGLRNRLAAALVNTFLSSDDWLHGAGVFAEYRAHLSMLGRTVTVLEAGGAYDALALDVDESGRLVVQKEDGERLTLSSGEISVKIPD